MLSPLNAKPSSNVATVCLPVLSSYTIREIPSAPFLPSIPSTPFSTWISTRLVPSTPLVPSLPLIPILPSLPSLPVTVIVSALRFLSSLTSIVVLPSASWPMIVLTFSPLYSVSALPPSPWTFTVEPSLLVFTPPELASKFKPLSINASAVFLRSVTFTAPFLVLLSLAAALILSK